MTQKVVTKFGLKVNGTEFSSWNRMRIDTSMNALCGSFVFSDMDFSRGNFESWKIKKTDLVTAFVEDQTLCTGYLDDIPVEYGARNSSISFIGRDKTMDLVDCCYVESNNSFKKQSRLNIIRRLILPYGTDIVIDPSASSEASVILDNYKVNEGETVGEMISEICRDAGILPMTFGDGKLTLTKATTTKSSKDPLEFDQNAVYGKLIQDDRNRFSKYITKGYGIGGDNKRLEDFINPVGVFEDPIIKRYRPKMLFAETKTDSGKCRDRSKWEARVRAGFSRGIIYFVPGWLQSDGSIWRINTLATVYDNFLGIKAQQFLISEASYIYDEEGVYSPLTGAFCILKLVDKDTYSGSAGDISIQTVFDGD
jgi:prophage tail gpP-like protein